MNDSVKKLYDMYSVKKYILQTKLTILLTPRACHFSSEFLFRCCTINGGEIRKKRTAIP